MTFQFAARKTKTVCGSRSQAPTRCICLAVVTLMLAGLLPTQAVEAAQLWAGAAKVDITNHNAGPANDLMYARALVIKNGETTFVLVSVDAVAIGEIGHIKDDYMANVRAAVQKELNIPPAHIMANASHCHGIVRSDSDLLTVEAIKKAAAKMVPVTVGVGKGHEDRIMENRRLLLKSGKELDVRHAYSLPADDEVAEVGPVDPEIGLLKLEREDGSTLAVVYNFACHPIQGVPSGANTADITGLASTVIEENLGDDTIALFVQGCGGDINPAYYKDVDHPRDAQTFGNMLALSTLRGLRKIECKVTGQLKVHNEILALPRADLANRITELESEQIRMAQSLSGTSISLKTFLPLMVKYHLSSDFPSYYSHRYLYDKKQGIDHLEKMDAYNRANMEKYIKNIHTMESLTRLNANLRLLKKHQAQNVAAGKRTVDVELMGVRVGDFLLTTFPGELTVRIGLNIKKKVSHKMTFVAGYTNGYIYYAPTKEQLLNVGGAQEDSDCILAPEWQEQYEKKAIEILSQL